VKAEMIGREREGDFTDNFRKEKKFNFLSFEFGGSSGPCAAPPIHRTYTLRS
jgi:hypothetical protein